MKKVLQKYWAWAFVVIPLLLQAIFFYVPMFQGAFYSFTNWTGLTYNYKFVGLNNFKLLFMDPKFMNAIGFTAIITIAMVVGEIALGIFIARVLNSKIKGQTFFRAWFFFPAVLSGLTVALIFKQVFNYGLPAIGNALHIEFLQTSLLGTKWGAIFAAVFVLLWQGVAMPIIIFLAGLQSIPTEITEAARIDGSGEFRTFNSIVLPLMKPAIAVQAIFTFVANWNNYFTPALVLHDDKMKTLPILIAQLRSADFLKFDMGQVYVTIAFSIFPVIIVYLFLSKYIVQGVAMGSVKG